jgi:hypothetical protein
MTDLPDVKLKALISFPATVNGGTAIDVTQSNGVYTFNLEYSDIQLLPSVPTAAIATSYFLGWESTTNQFGLVPTPAAGLITKVPTRLAATPAVMDITDSSIIDDVAGTTVITLLTAANYAGRWLYIKSTTSGAVNSASSNVIPLTSTTPGTAILAASPGKWAILQFDGTNWQIMAAN